LHRIGGGHSTGVKQYLPSTAALLATAAQVLPNSAAYAHGAVGMEDNRCVLRIGPDLMFFTSYQPQNSRDEFCDDIPSTGQTVVALDMQELELRNMLAEIRLIKDDGTHTQMNGLPFLSDAELANKAALDAVSVAYFPPKKYPTGTLTFEHTFPENGKFIGIVTVENDHGQRFVSQFPFAVGFEKIRLIDFLLDYEKLIGSNVQVEGGQLQTVGGQAQPS
jgi:hypothetical protein